MNSEPNNLLQTSNDKVLLLCDFDGTISTKDTVNKLIRNHLTCNDWRFQLKRYLRGDIGSKKVYEAVSPLMSMTRVQLEDFVNDHAALDPHFPQFLGWAKEKNIDVKVVSDGFDETIFTLFRNHSITDVEVYSNSLSFTDDGRVRMEHPYSDPDCGWCGTCKLSILNKFRDQYSKIILIGDGESDRHAAQKADFVIGLKDLFAYCTRHDIPCIRADGFHEIPFLLERKISAITYDMDGTLIDSMESIKDAFNHMFSKLGYPSMTTDEVARNTSVSLLDFVKFFLKPEEAEIGVKIFRDYYDGIFLEKTKIMPGVPEMIESLDGTVAQGIVTNKRGKYARILAEYFGIGKKMIKILGAEDGFKAKPAPDMFEEFMKFSGCDKRETIYVGDSPIDIVAAHNSGIDAFVVAGPIFSAEELGNYKPRRVLRNISELPAAIRPLV